MTDSTTDSSEPRKDGVVSITCGPMVHGGLCLSHLEDGTTVLVDGAIPGEQVQARLDYRKRKTWFATVLSAVQPSEHRVTPPCPYVGQCGGCQLQHVDYSHQLRLKQEIVADAMHRQHVVLPNMQVHGMDDPWRYRWRGEFHVVPGERGHEDAGLGFNRVRSWKPVAVDDCLIHHPTIAKALPALRDAVHRGGDEGLTALHLTVGEEGAELVVRPRPRKSLDAAVVDAVALENGCRWSTQGTTLQWRGHTFRVTAESFIQVNWTQMDVLYECVLRALSGSECHRVVDAYAGMGVLSTVIADLASEVICIENNQSAVAMGMLNVRLNGVEDRVHFVEGNVEDVLAGVCSGADVDVVVLDPPRSGCGGQVTGFLALAGPPRVVYVSCDPATMARDLRILVAAGPYRIESFDLVDMFPQTYHVESVALLVRE